MAWLPSLVTLIIGILGQLNAADWVAQNPDVAMALGTVGGLATALTRSPLAKPGAPPTLGGFRAFVLLLALMVPVTASAQTVSVDLNRATLAWNWAPASAPNDGPVESFEFRCGKVAGVYSALTPVNDPLARTIALRQVIPSPGVWFCAVNAVNRYGHSLDSNTITFDAGAAPAVPSSLTVQVK